MRKFERFMTDVLLAKALQILGILLLITVSLQIASRYLPIQATWTDELSRLLFVWFSMLATAMAYIKNKHLSIDILYNKLPKAAQTFLDYFGIILVLATSVLLSYTGIKLLSVVAFQKAPILKIQMGWFYASCPACFLFIGVHSIMELIQKIQDHDGKTETGGSCDVQ